MPLVSKHGYSELPVGNFSSLSAVIKQPVYDLLDGLSHLVSAKTRAALEITWAYESEQNTYRLSRSIRDERSSKRLPGLLSS